MEDEIYVGIGASAGGLKTFEELISSLPEHKNYIYIIAQHLDPKKKSSLVEILSRYTSMGVHEVTTTTTFTPNNVYIIPAGFNLILQNNTLTLQKTESSTHTPTPSIDTLFQTLASFKGENTIGILLSGTGHDGTNGIKKIKEFNGTTIAQEPHEALYKAMPQNAIESHNVEYILNIEEIVKGLSSSLHPKSAIPFQAIQKLLHKQKKLNIEKYKSETILRRIHKRMLLVHTPHLESYLKYLDTNKEELTLLYQNILIGVTTFFRDKEAFEALKNEIYFYLQKKPQGSEIKVWCIACSTGEEAYSLAIVISQVCKELNKEFKIKIFASDIDDKALNKARSATYTHDSLHNLDKELIKEYFTKTDDGYKIVEKIRQKIVFTQHNILNDPPFINQDIISCRNLLIYIKPEIQQEIFTLLHYTLKDDGILFLGSSESTLISIKYFNTINSEYKIYTKEKLKNPPKISSHYFSRHVEDKDATQSIQVTNDENFNIEESINEALFSFFIPQCIVIDKELSIVYKKGELPFVNMPDGFVTLNIIENLHKSLQYEVRRTIELTFSTNKPQTTKFIELQLNDEQTFLRVVAYPFQHSTPTNMLLLYFQHLNAGDLQFNTRNLNLPDESFIIKSLTNQLAQTQEDNHILSDKLSVFKENMQLLNEELQSANEELQSSNEELETSNEELQSSNEELHISIISEQKLQEQLSGILNASQNGIIGLNLEGRHIFVNDATLDILGFAKEDLIGKDAHNLWHYKKPDGSPFPFEECQLHSHLKNKKSVRIQDVFWKKDGTPLDVEVLQNPLFENDEVVGAVLSFHDITEKNILKKELKHEHQLADLYMNIVGTLVMTLDLDGNITMINKEGAKLLGASQKNLIGKNWFENFIPQENIEEMQGVFHSIVNGNLDLVAHYKNTIIDSNKQEHILAWTNDYTRDVHGTITGIISSGTDITKEEQLSQKLSEQEYLYKLTFEEADIGIAHTSLDGRWIDTNEYMSKLLGYTKDELIHMNISDVTFEEDKDTDRLMMQNLLQKNKSNYHIEKRYIHKDGTIIWISLSVVVLKDKSGEALYLLKIIKDISELKLLMQQLEAQKDKFETIISFTPIPLILYDEKGDILLTNNIFNESTGYQKDELKNIKNLVDTLFIHEDIQTKQQHYDYYKNPLAQAQVQQTISTKSGEKRVGILNAVMLNEIDDSTKRLYLIAIVDITDLQKKDDLMVAQSRQAAMGDMLAMIAHQWRQPLSVISMLANNIKVQVELEEEITKEDIQHLVTTLNKQTQYLSQTIDDFRDFFKPDKVKESINVDVIIDKVQSLMSQSLHNNNITLQLPPKTDLSIFVFTNQLLQVIINIINNAKDAIKSNQTIDGWIKIQVDKEGSEMVKISICDNGGGIDTSIQDKLGQPYVSTKSKNGTGLGLYMSIMIVKNYLDGQIEWKSDDKGSCFYITLPTTQ